MSLSSQSAWPKQLCCRSVTCLDRASSLCSLVTWILLQECEPNTTGTLQSVSFGCLWFQKNRSHGPGGLLLLFEWSDGLGVASFNSYPLQDCTGEAVSPWSSLPACSPSLSLGCPFQFFHPMLASVTWEHPHSTFPENHGQIGLYL